MVVLTRQERRRRVLELHDQGLGTREIAEILQMSFRDIGEILKDADKMKEVGQLQAQQQILSSRAYEMYSNGKRPVEVAIKLNIRSAEAIMFLREYWELQGSHNLNLVYEEIKDDVWHLVNLWKSVKAAGMQVPHIITLLTIANNDLLGVQQRYNFLKQEVKSLQEQKTNLYNRITEEGSNLQYYRAACQREKVNFDTIRDRRMKEETLVEQFRNDNSEYVKIRKTVEEKVAEILSERKVLLKLAVLSLTESIRANPEKYSSLVQQDRASWTDHVNADFNPYWIYGQQPPWQQKQSKVYFVEDYIAMLIDDAEMLLERLMKELGEEILRDYPVSNLESSLPMLPP